jgi:hypothetical protein
MNYMPLRRMPSEMHAREVHAHEMYASEVYAREVRAHEMYAREVHAHEMHARQMHAHEIHAREICPHEMHELERCIEILIYPQVSICLAVSVTLLTQFSGGDQAPKASSIHGVR